jgi:hypothetical protein
VDAGVARHRCDNRAELRRLVENPVFIRFAEPPPMTLADRGTIGPPGEEEDKPRGLRED